MRNDIKRSVTGPEGSFPNPGEGTLISEITFEANVDPDDRFPGYGLYKVFLISLEYCLVFLVIQSCRSRCPASRGAINTAGR